MSDFPKFRVIELKYAHPQTGARFWIEWEQDFEREEEHIKKGFINLVREFFGLKLLTEKVIVPFKDFVIFSDPATTESNQGYKTMAEAMFTIERYKITRTPIIHNV